MSGAKEIFDVILAENFPKNMKTSVTDPKYSMNLKQDKDKENYTYVHNIYTSKINDNLKKY